MTAPDFAIDTSWAERILDVQPTSLHQRVPLIIGSRDDVREYGRFYREATASAAD